MTILKIEQSDWLNIFKNLIELEHNIVEAYEIAVKRIKSKTYQDELTKFKVEHQNHIDVIITILKKHKIIIGPTQDIEEKQVLSKGKVVMSSLMRDNSILLAMISNEIDVNDAYNHIYTNIDTNVNKWGEIKDTLQHIIEDEKKHKFWLENTMLK